MLDKLYQCVNQRPLYFVESHVGDRPSYLQPIFFYHTPKAAGNAIIVPLNASYHYETALREKPTDFIYNRFEALNAANQRISKIPFYLLATHHSFGFHEQFPRKDYKLMACLRDPVERIKSAYFYEMMRNDWEPERDDFQLFFDDKTHQNLITKQFAGNDPSKQKDTEHTLFERAKENLKKIDYVMFQDQITLFLQWFLSMNGLCSTLSTAINVTAARYKMDLSMFDKQIADFNRLDMELLAWARTEFSNAPFLSQPIDHTDAVAPIINFCFESQKQKGADFRFAGFHFDLINEAIENVIKQGTSYDTLSEFCYHELMSENQKKNFNIPKIL